jgi:hypothetical protein
LQYFAGIATLLVLTASAMTWSWGNARVAFFYRDDVRVISANTLGSAVVVNRGDGEAFVENLSRAIYSAEIPTIEVARQERICARVERQ